MNVAIPGRKLNTVEIRAKIKVGLKNERGYPQSVDYFVTDDPEVGERVSELRIVFPYPTADECFRTGLEWWVGKIQACFTHDQDDPTAYRVDGLEVKEGGRTKVLSWLDPDDELRGEKVGKSRQPIKCRADACPHFGENSGQKQCRPSGRLTFFIEGGRQDMGLEFLTHGWFTIERLAGTLAACERSGPLNAPGRSFLLNVVMQRKGDNRFPVVSIKEEKVEVKTPEDLELASSLLGLRKQVDEFDAHADSDELGIRLALSATLGYVYGPEWRDNAKLIDRIKEAGVVNAAKGLLTKYNL
jgi:hypothetical protein